MKLKHVLAGNWTGDLDVGTDRNNTGSIWEPHWSLLEQQLNEIVQYVNILKVKQLLFANEECIVLFRTNVILFLVASSLYECFTAIIHHAVPCLCVAVHLLLLKYNLPHGFNQIFQILVSFCVSDTNIKMDLLYCKIAAEDKVFFLEYWDCGWAV